MSSYSTYYIGTDSLVRHLNIFPIWPSLKLIWLLFTINSLSPFRFASWSPKRLLHHTPCSAPPLSRCCGHGTVSDTITHWHRHARHWSVRALVARVKSARRDCLYDGHATPSYYQQRACTVCRYSRYANNFPSVGSKRWLKIVICSRSRWGNTPWVGGHPRDQDYFTNTRNCRNSNSKLYRYSIPKIWVSVIHWDEAGSCGCSCYYIIYFHVCFT